MRRYWVFAFAVAGILSLAPQSSGAPQFGRERQAAGNRGRVCFYKDSQYQGWEQCYTVGDEVRSLGDHKGQASSIRVFGPVRVTVYDKTDFRGRVAQFSSDVPNLSLRSASGGHTWNDRIESVRLAWDSRPGPVGTNRPTDSRNQRQNWDRHERVEDRICVYDRRNFQGRSQCWSAGANLRDLARTANWSDRIASIRVFGRAVAVVYRDVGFRGESIMIRQDVPDLSRIEARRFRNWNRQISSIHVEIEGRFSGADRGRAQFGR